MKSEIKINKEFYDSNFQTPNNVKEYVESSLNINEKRDIESIILILEKLNKNQDEISEYNDL